jgi:hypothetical protein
MKQSAKLYRAISATSAMLAFTSVALAEFNYNFDGLSGSPNPGTPLVGSSTFAGTVGQDNWILTMGTTGQVRSDPPTAFSNNYLSATAAMPTSGFDGIFTRLGDNLGLNVSSGFATFQFDGLVGPGYVNSGNTTVSRRSEIAPGIDANLDGDIRGTASSTENSEVAFQFGYESTGTGWFVRRAAFSNTGSVTANTNASGTYRMQLVVDFNANPVVIGGQTFNDGAGTLYVKQLADADGNPVNDVFRLAAPTTANVNMGLATGMGTFGAANPANWNGVMARVANNGGIDNIVFGSGLPVTPPTWAADAGNWLSSGNWYLTVPNAAGAEADFTMGARSSSTVFADSPVTVGTLKFDNPFGYVIAGAASLTLQTVSGAALVDVQAGSHKINLPLIIASDTTLNVAPGATLRISDPVTVNSGKSVTQTGGGLVIYESNVTLQSSSNLAFANSTFVHALTVASNATASIMPSPVSGSRVLQADTLSLSGSTDAWSGKLDLGNNDFILRNGTLAQLSNQVKSGYSNGAWNGGGISSSAAPASAGQTGLGYASAASLFNLTGTGTATFDGQTVDANSLVVKYTYNGDANLDGKVDTLDFNLLAANFGGTGKVWIQADFNFDGKVDTLDFNKLAANFGRQLSDANASLSGALVPEPGACGVLIVTGAGLLTRRRK